MTRGISVPVRAFRGRLVLEEGERQIGKLGMLCVSDGDSANPFNDDAGIRHPIFSLDDPTTRAEIRRAIEGQFRRLEADEKAKLLRIEFSPLADGEQKINVTYRNLETDDEDTVTRAIRRLG